MNDVMSELRKFRDQDVLQDIDLELCYFLQAQHSEVSDIVLQSACLASYLYRQGDVCLLLEKYASQPFFDESEVTSNFKAPDLQSWERALSKSEIVGNPGDFKPLILDEGGRLYLHKLWHYEYSLAQELIRRSKIQASDVDNELLKKGLDRLFPDPPKDEVDWQRVAAAMSVKQKLSVISGGPGTGKTSTVVRILGLLLEQIQAKAESLNIALAAPTGKAAARLKDSIMNAKEGLDVSDKIRSEIPEKAHTIHQLLGARRHSSQFRHNADNPVPYDLVIVDEASMVDQALMSKLLDALLDDTRLILLGDKDQLASVEAGSVLGDVCSINQNQFSEQAVSWLNQLELNIPESYIKEDPKPLTDHITLLTKSYRFGPDSGIARLADAVNAGRVEKATNTLESDDFADVSLVSIEMQSDLETILRQHIVEYFRDIVQGNSVKQSLKAFNRLRILSPHRKGPRGVAFLNQYVEKILQDEGLIPKYERWYHGRPVIIDVNDYSLRLHNGDTGICLLDDDGTKKVYFRDEDSIRGIAPGRLPDHDTAFALTVHKSQGSEFEEVLFVLPHKPSKVLNCELIYTATTRARTKISVLGERKILHQGVEKQLQRSSGLKPRVWK